MAITERQVAALFTAIQTVTRVLKGAQAQGLAQAAEPLHPSEVLALMYIGARPGAIQSDVAEALGISATTASSIIDRLEHKRLVERTRPAANRRIVQLGLSGEGAAAYRLAVDEQLRHCRAMLKALAPAQRDQFVELMQTIAQSLDSDSTHVKS